VIKFKNFYSNVNYFLCYSLKIYFLVLNQIFENFSKL
jgi:hypothetical protein